MREAITTVNVCYSYADGTPALNNISLEIAPGESVAIVGANGAGKSTLLLLLAGCLMPQSGKITVAGITLEKKNLSRIRTLAGLVFQNPDDQLFMPTVFDDVAFGPANMGLNDDEIRQRVERALATVSIAHLAERSPQRLSAGEKQAAAIATILAIAPPILLLDEPSSNLDPRNRRHLITLLKELPQTGIIATHDMDLALDVCDRTIIISRGEIAADGPTGEIMTDDRLLRECALERPLRLQH